MEAFQLPATHPIPSPATRNGRIEAPSPARWSPTRLDHPAFLMSCPFSFATACPNNPWMQDLAPAERQPNLRKAFAQFMELYRFLSSEGLVYLLPGPEDCGLQDLVFTGNLGIVLEHLDRDVVVISNYTSEPRRGEAEVGRRLFKAMGYEVRTPQARFEGDAELKHLHDNVYIGGYGLRSERAAYEWMERTFDMVVIPVELRDPYLYHLDCTVFPVTHEEVMVCTELYEPEELRAIEQHAGIIDVTVDDCYAGICNSVRLTNTILNASNLQQLKAGTQDYQDELQKNRHLEDIAFARAFEVNYFNLSEYMKGGALLSCMVMHLNRYSYTIRLTT